MRTVYEAFMALPIEKGLLCLEPVDMTQSYFCYPVNAEPIGSEGCILYCFLPEYGEMVFACNPERCADQYVYPLAVNFEDFIRLILACGTVNPVEQIVGMTREQFDKHLEEEKKILTGEQKAAVKMLQQELGLSPMHDPYDYVKSIQKDFDDSKIQYRDEYYDVTGIKKPKARSTSDQPFWEFEPVLFAVHKQDDTDQSIRMEQEGSSSSQRRH